MPAFRKKPVVVNAQRVMERTILSGTQTLHGQDLIAEAGDWVVQGIKGELYPCKDNIFRETYEPVGKDGVHALVAPGPNQAEESASREYIIPFPTLTTSITT